MAYFFSSLAYIKGAPLVYVDHPGTPIEIWGAFIFCLTYPLTWWSRVSLFDFHIQHPGVFLIIVRTSVSVLNIIGAVFLAISFWRKRDAIHGLLAVSLAALYFALHPSSFDMTTIWTHNAFNFSLGTTLLVILYLLLRRDRCLATREIILIGAAAGFLSAFTIYMATWVVGICLALFLFELFRKEGVDRALANSITAGVSSLASFILVTLPMGSHYRAFLKWIYQLIIHKDRYGFGEVGIVPPDVLGQRLATMLRVLPLLALGIALAVMITGAVLVQGRKIEPRKNGLLAFIVAGIIQLILSLLIVAKHPGGVYLLAGAAILPPLIGASLEALEGRKLFKIISVSLSLLILAAFTYNCIFSLKIRNDNVDLMVSGHRSIDEFLQDTAKQIGNPRNKLKVLWTYGVYDACNARWFGNDYGAGALSDRIRKVCHNDAGLNIFNGNVNTGVQTTPLAESRWDIIVFRESIFKSYLTRLVFAEDYQIVESKIESPIEPYGPIIFLVSR